MTIDHLAPPGQWDIVLEPIKYAVNIVLQQKMKLVMTRETGNPSKTLINRLAENLAIPFRLILTGGALVTGLCFGAAKADILFTTDVGGNSQNGNIFDISAKKSITINGFYQNFQQTGMHNFEAYYRLGTAVGTTSSTPGWILLGTANNFNVATAGIYSLVPFNSSIRLSINAGSRIGLWLRNSDDGLSNIYTNGTSVGAAYASDGNLIIYEGYGANNGGGVFSPRIWNGGIIYVAGLAYSSTLQPYASNQSIGLDALKNQRELVLNQAGDCDQRGWVVYDSIKNQPQAKTKKHQSLCIFAEGGNATGTINGTNTLGGYNTANASSAYGLEWKLSKQWAVGAAYGYGSTNLSNFNFQDTSASIGSTNNSGALYGVYRPDKQQRWKIAGLFGYSGFSYTGSRSYLGDVANSAYNASGYTGALQASYDIPLTTDYNNKKNRLSPVRIKPMLGLAYGSQQQDGFSESGAGTLVNVQGQTTNSLLGSVGVSLEAPIALNKKKTTVLVPKIGVAYQYDFLADQDGNRSITASLKDDATTSYTVQGQNRGSSNLQLNLGADLQLNPKTVLYAGVNYQAFNNGDQFGYQGGLRYKF